MTLRLSHIALSDWATFDGYAVAHGMKDLRTIDFGRFVNFIWWMVTRERDPKDVQKFKARLWIPPEGAAVPDNSPWSDSNTRKGFDSLASQLGVNPQR